MSLSKDELDALDELIEERLIALEEAREEDLKMKAQRLLQRS